MWGLSLWHLFFHRYLFYFYSLPFNFPNHNRWSTKSMHWSSQVRSIYWSYVDKCCMSSSICLFSSEMIITPAYKYFNPFEILKRHYYAPRANTLEELYSCFTGGSYNISERFTVSIRSCDRNGFERLTLILYYICWNKYFLKDFTKVLLFAIFYAPFMPLVYFQCAAVFVIQYWMDKFLLLVSMSKFT